MNHPWCNYSDRELGNALDCCRILADNEAAAPDYREIHAQNVRQIEAEMKQREQAAELDRAA